MFGRGPAAGRVAHLEKDVSESRPTAEHVEVFLVVVEADKAGDRVDELHVRQVALALEVVEEGGVFVTEVLQRVGQVRLTYVVCITYIKWRFRV